MRKVVAGVVLVGVVALPAGLARAYCRTTTVHEPVPYDPVASGCWTQGTPLAWQAGADIGYSLSQAASDQLSLADATRVADAAFDTWNGVECPGNVALDVHAYDEGPVSEEAAVDDCGLVACDPTYHDPLHVIVFDDVKWPHDDPNNTLALTTVTYGVDDGRIFDADIEVNTAQHTITAAEPPPDGSYDLQAILTHEAGHFFGLAHATETTPIMYAQYQPGAITLTSDDVAGVCAIYPPSAKHSGGCAAAPAGDASGGAWAATGAMAL
ncbi:MAG TPA: matrixin family metalloprotease, partial [Polyangiaceae bacterium]